MLTKTIHRIWNERKQNVWLFLELFVVAIFIWLAIDQLFNLVSRGNIEQGYDDENIYCIYFKRHDTRSHKYKAGFNDKEIIFNGFRQIIKRIESLPEVETYCVSGGEYPGSASQGVTQATVDSTVRADGKSITANVSLYQNKQTDKSDYFATFNIKDAFTGEILKKRIVEQGYGIYISKNLAETLFGTENGIGEKVTLSFNNNLSCNVLGVFENVQTVIYSEPKPLVILTNELYDRNAGVYFTYRTIHIKLKKGVDKERFEKRFHDDIMPQLTAGNIYCNELISCTELKKMIEKQHGIKNKYRQSIILSTFALLCGLLGIIGTFWVRAIARRREIGIMQSIGATRIAIVKQFILEAMILVSVAFMLAMPVVLHKVHITGFAEPLNRFMQFKPIGETAMWYTDTLPHFAIVTAISYLLISTICIVGAVVPTQATMKKNVADALREEL